MKKTTLVVLFSFFNLLFLQAKHKINNSPIDTNFEVSVSLTGEVMIELLDYDVFKTYDWEFEYGISGFQPGTGTVQNISGIHFYRFKINPLKKYDFRVRQRQLLNNSLVWSDWSAVKTIFATSDKVYSVGYSTDFNDKTAADLEWRGMIYNNSTSMSGVYISSNENHSDTGEAGNCVNMTNYHYENGNEIAFVSPKFNDLATDRKVKFWIYYYHLSEIDLKVGTMSDPYDLSTFHPLTTVESVSATSGWNQFTTYFNNYTGTDEYVVFLFKRKYYGAEEDISIDDFSYEKAADCFDQTNFAIKNIVQNSAEISFEHQNQSNFQVSVTNVARHTTEILNIQSSPFVINNLTGNTDYEVKVRANCIDDLFSNWTKTISFKTPCTVISDHYSTSFEGSKYIDPCWSVIANNALIQTSLEATPWPKQPVPKTGNATVIISTFLAKLNVDKAYLITPYIADLDADKRVKFSLLSYSGGFYYNSTSLTIGTMSDPADEKTFIPLKTILPSEMNEIDNLNKSSLWKEHTVYLDNYSKSNNHHYIALRYNNESDSDFIIDDFIYEKVPSCLEPLNPRTIKFDYDYATVTWDNYKPATEWEVEYGPKGFEHGAGKIVTATSFPFKITESVLEDTEYDFYVRNKCVNGYSGWSDKGYFRTKCLGITAGYKDDFETFAFEKNGCWTRIVPNFTENSFYTKNDFIASVKQSAPNYLVHSGLRSICLLNSPDVLFPPGTGDNADRVVLVSPRIKDFDHYKKISFWMTTRQQSTKSPAQLIVGTMSDPDDATTFIPYRTIDIAVNNQDKSIKYEIEFSDYYGTDKFIAFKQSKTNVRLTDFYIDDFEYSKNDCTRPGLVGAQQSGIDSATLDWRDNNTNKPSESWDIEYGPKGFADGSGTIINAKTNPFNLTGLIQGIYDYRVRAYCEAGSLSDWSDRYTFKIGCTEKIPFVENFDQYPLSNEIPNFCWTKSSWIDTQLLAYNLVNINSAPNVFYLQNNADTAFLVSPYLDDFDKNKKIKFWLNAQITSGNVESGSLIIGTIKNPLDISTFEPYQTISLEELRKIPAYGKEINIDFSEYKGFNKHIAFTFKLDQGASLGTNRVLIDDFNYDQTLSCYEPLDVVFSNINNNSVQINWTSKNALPEKVQIEYGETGFFPGTGTILNTTANEIKVANLQAGISYQFYFTTVCDSGNSILVGPKKIETTCSVKPLPWKESFTNLNTYGRNILPDCFKLLHGTVILENTAVPEVYSNYSPDYLRDGFDDHSYLYFNGEHWTDLMTPMFHLEAGTTYKFSLKARNSYEYRTQGVGLSIGRGQNNYNMETRLGGSGRLTEYNYSDVLYYFTPVVSGDYSFLMDFSNAGAPNLLADNFELKEGYKAVIDANKNAAVYDFQKEITDDIILEKTYETISEIADDNQSAGNKVVVMRKSYYENKWLTSADDSKFAKTNENVPSVWELNQSSIAKINTKVDAKNTTSLFMSFELRQTFVDRNTESMFRVIVNGNVVGDIIKPLTNNGDRFQKYVFDLTPYVGTEIKISLQHIGKSELGDIAILDNLIFAKTLENLSVVENTITDFKYYPNPVENILNIESNSIISNLEVYNLNGQLLFESKYSDSKIGIDFKRYAAGVYLIVLTKDDKKESFKVIKK